MPPFDELPEKKLVVKYRKWKARYDSDKVSQKFPETQFLEKGITENEIQ